MAKLWESLIHHKLIYLLTYHFQWKSCLSHPWPPLPGWRQHWHTCDFQLQLHRICSVLGANSLNENWKSPFSSMVKRPLWLPKSYHCRYHLFLYRARQDPYVLFWLPVSLLMSFWTMMFHLRFIHFYILISPPFSSMILSMHASSPASLLCSWETYLPCFSYLYLLWFYLWTACWAANGRCKRFVFLTVIFAAFASNEMTSFHLPLFQCQRYLPLMWILCLILDSYGSVWGPTFVVLKCGNRVCRLCLGFQSKSTAELYFHLHSLSFTLSKCYHMASKFYFCRILPRSTQNFWVDESNAIFCKFNFDQILYF